MNSVTRELIAKAKHDLNSAIVLSDAGPRKVGHQNIGFHLQQAVEKATKALLVENNVQIPKIHPIEDLFDILTTETGILIPVEFVPLQNLTVFAVTARYETVVDRPFHRKMYLELVENFLRWVGEQV